MANWRGRITRKEGTVEPDDTSELMTHDLDLCYCGEEAVGWAEIRTEDDRRMIEGRCPLHLPKPRVVHCVDG